MELHAIFSLYGDCLPMQYDIKDTSHGDADFRQAIFTEWKDKKLVIKIACNDFTTPARIQGWRDTIEAYRALGYYCPPIVQNKNGRYAETVEYNNKMCVVYAEEFSTYKTAEQYGRKAYKPSKLYVYHEDAIRCIGSVGARHLTTAEFPSGICILETFSPSDPCDEIMENALDFKRILEEKFPQYKSRFEKIWASFLQNKAELERIYPNLPTSVFQADLNPTNVLLNANMRFAGVMDFNLCGRDTVLNCLFREAFTDFYEDVTQHIEKNTRYYDVFYYDAIHEKAMASFFNNIQLIKQTYTFSDAEKKAAILLYRYLRPFWWQPCQAISQSSIDADKAAEILTWIENEQKREIDFAALMS